MPTINKHYWKAWLRKNFLTQDVENDLKAEVSTVGKTQRNADIARLIIESGSELQFETLLDILNRSDRHRLEKLQEGYSVQTLICRLSPRILGSWTGGSKAFDPARHKLTLDIAPTAEMRAALAEVGVDILGIREGGAYIGLVTDVTTGLTDGTITPGGQIVISGEKIKVEPPEGAGGVGVFLTNGSGTHPVGPLAINRPKEIISIVPPLPPGSYSLYILTRYVRGKLLNEPRKIDYITPLIVGDR
ncbi:MAG: DUF4469 domain-containing protein [Tannerellaceae bacterium]|jgi:hypothetical protein|nr:DUF4469 domain-containing protein [Tannerellaceae bacterium]